MRKDDKGDGKRGDNDKGDKKVTGGWVGEVMPSGSDPGLGSLLHTAGSCSWVQKRGGGGGGVAETWQGSKCQTNLVRARPPLQSPQVCLVFCPSPPFAENQNASHAPHARTNRKGERVGSLPQICLAFVRYSVVGPAPPLPALCGKSKCQPPQLFVWHFDPCRFPVAENQQCQPPKLSPAF